jgi:hypothetical protein
MNHSKLRSLLTSLALCVISLTTISCGLSVTGKQSGSITPLGVPPTPDPISKATFIKDLEKEAARTLTEMGVKNITVSCPPNITAADVGKIFDCQVSSEQGKFLYEVNYKAPQDIGFKGKRIALIATVESLIQNSIKEKSNVDVTVNCGAHDVIWIYQKVGDTRECSITGVNAKATAVIKTTTEYGGVTVEIKDN